MIVRITRTSSADPGRSILPSIELDGVCITARRGARGRSVGGRGTPCVGPGTIVVPVTHSSFVAFRLGSASVTTNVGVVNQTTFNFFTKTLTQSIRITRTPITYIDPLSHSVVRHRVRLR